MKKRLVFFLSIVIVLLSLILIKANNQEKSLSATKLKEENNDLIGIYVKDKDTYTRTKTIPTGNYVLNEDESYCKTPTKETEKITNIINYDNKTQTLTVKNLNDINTKCFLYFDQLPTVKDVLSVLDVSSQGEQTSFSGAACTGHSDCKDTTYTGHVYSAPDDYGISYYFRGSGGDTDKNWVKIGNMYWRIIRINGNGTLRLIYNGTKQNATGADAQIGTKPFNSNSGTVSGETATHYNDNAYVGYMFGQTGASSHALTHANTHESLILQNIKTWYNANLAKYSSILDGATGFCGDRDLGTGISGYTGGGYGKQLSVYAPWSRLYNGSWKSQQTPTLKCNSKKRDLYTTTAEPGDGNGALPVPVGLITSDEVVFAGGFGGANNQKYWLYTGQNYWTLSPCNFYSGHAWVFLVYSNGTLGSNYVSDPYGVRPVINLKANTKFKPGGNGTASSPLEVDV